MGEIKVNQSTLERFVRIVAGGILLALAVYVPMNVILTWVVAIIGIVLLLTGLSGWCPVYSLLNISTKK